MPALSVVVPVYCAAESLPELHRRLSAVLEGHPGDFEILFVGDCGGDNSWEVIQRLAATDPRVRSLRMSRNYGQHNALLCGIRAARCEVIITSNSRSLFLNSLILKDIFPTCTAIGTEKSL